MSSRVVRTRLAVPSCLYLQKMRLIGAGLLIGLLLAGCAAERSYHDGKELVKSDKVEDALTKFQLAMAQDPQNYEYRMAYLQTKERAVSNYLEKADRLADAEKTDDAEKLYQRVLAIDASSERARTGLRNLEMGKRHAQLLKDVAGAIEKNDMVTANMKLATVLTENPKSEAARALQNAIAAKNVQPPVDALLSNAYKKPITIQFKDSPLKQIFEVISRTSGLNFLFDKDVKLDQKSSIFLKDGTIESAVYYTLLTNQLEQQILDGNTILIYPNNAAKLKEYQDMVIRSFFLAYADAKVIATNLKALLKSKDIVIDEKLNMVMMRDSPNAIRQAEKIIALQDVPEPEVMLEVEILEVKRTKLLELGIQWPDSLT
ncbi:MAG: secretin N-terminal domain-containing protein, partial [Burkholderiaceae bacterium]